MHCGHSLLFIPASCLFCLNSVAPHPYLPGNHWPSSCLATPWPPDQSWFPTLPWAEVREGHSLALVICLALSCRVQSLGTGIPLMTDLLPPIPILLPSSPDLVNALCWRLDAPWDLQIWPSISPSPQGHCGDTWAHCPSEENALSFQEC